MYGRKLVAVAEEEVALAEVAEDDGDADAVGPDSDVDDADDAVDADDAAFVAPGAMLSAEAAGGGVLDVLHVLHAITRNGTDRMARIARCSRSGCLEFKRNRFHANTERDFAPGPPSHGSGL
jgi:hypothetical protein